MALRCAYDQWRCAAWPKPEPQSHCCSSGAIYDEEKENLGVLFCYNIDAFRPPPIRLPSDMRTGCRSPSPQITYSPRHSFEDDEEWSDDDSATSLPSRQEAPLPKGGGRPSGIVACLQGSPAVPTCRALRALEC